jgi:hypothetical protein
MEQPKHTTLGISRNQSEYKVITHSGYFRRSFLTSHRFLHLFLSFFLLLTSHSYATILTVKQDGTGDFTVIQEAYLAASSGDTILVYPGTYYENIDLTYSSKNITIASLYLVTQDKSYIHNTIIDGNHNGSCIAIRNTENAEIVICGFTIQNGSGYGSNSKRGGGIYVFHADPEIHHCFVENNKAVAGGGIYTRYSETFLSGCTIRYNHAFTVGGGLICSYDASIIFDSQIKCNLYLNYSPYGSDYSKTSYCPPQVIIVDTFTVINPDQHFIYSFDVYNYPVNDLIISIENAKIEPVDHDLYVDPVSGCNENDGLTPQAALKTIAYAYHIIASNSLDPHSIYLNNGVYSPSTNGELFPLNGRSYVSLIGTNRDSTIFDADSLYFFFKAYGLMEKFTLKNISLKNGYGLLSSNNFSGLVIDICKNVTIENISFFNCVSSLNPGIYCNDSDSVLINKLYFKDNIGGRVFAIGNSFEPPKSFKIENCIIIGAGPLPDINDGEGNGLGVSGSLPEPGLIKGKIKNLQLTDNLRVPDPWWGPGMAGPLIICWHATVDMSNATIGNNTVRGEQGYAVNVDEGSELNIYNSIIYGDSLYELSLGSHSGSDFPATANIAYSNIEGGEAEIMNWYNQNTLNWLDGNMDEDPLWAGTGDTAYYLLPGSPCVNAGTPMYEEGMDYPYIKMEDDKIVLYKYDGDTIHLPPTDLAGKPRISGGRIDMGAYEYQDTTTGIGNPGKTSRDDNKVQVYPNPFSAHTFITFRIQNPAQVVVKITDINGRPVKILMNAKLTKGEFSMTWKGEDDEGDVVKNGTYIVTFYLNGVSVEGVKLVKRNGR